MEPYTDDPLERMSLYTPDRIPDKAIKGVQLTLADGALPSVYNRSIYWKKDSSSIKIGRAAQSSHRRPADPNSFTVHCPVMSREHAVLEIEGDDLYITDTNSHHGTWRSIFGVPQKIVAGERLLVSSDDVFTFGRRVEKGGEPYFPATISVKFIYDDVEPHAAPEQIQPSNRFGIYIDEDEIIDNASEASGDSDNGSEHSLRHLAPIGSLLGGGQLQGIFTSSNQGDERHRSPSIHISSDDERDSPEPEVEAVWMPRSPAESPKRAQIFLEEQEPVSQSPPSPLAEGNILPFFSRSWAASGYPRLAPVISPLRPQREAMPIVLNPDLEEQSRLIRSMQSDVEKLKIFKQKAKSRIMNNQRTADGRFDKIDDLLEDNDQRLEDLEEKLQEYSGEMQLNMKDQRHIISELDGACNGLLSEVNHIRADVLTGKNEVAEMLNDVKRLSVDARSIVSAQLEDLQRQREADAERVAIRKENRKRSIDLANEDDEEYSSAPIALPPRTYIIEEPDSRPSKRARIDVVIPSAAGVLAGVMAGGILTWAGLAYC